MKFIDLFSGLGGFHIALNKLGFTCVLACEIDKELRECYHKNFNLLPHGDITQLNIKKIPKHDILCAGFPCQPFSNAGSQQGMKCPVNGKLFNYILKILKQHKPSYFMLENVPNLVTHNNKKTWAKMRLLLESLGYSIKWDVLSPHNYGIPQQRKRLFVLGSLHSLNRFEFPKKTNSKFSMQKYLTKTLSAEKLEKEKHECLKIWNEFISLAYKKGKIPSFPIWVDFFTKKKNPFSSKDWKFSLFEKNKEFYLKNKKWIDAWKKKTDFF